MSDPDESGSEPDADGEAEQETNPVDAALGENFEAWVHSTCDDASIADRIKVSLKRVLLTADLQGADLWVDVWDVPARARLRISPRGTSEVHDVGPATRDPEEFWYFLRGLSLGQEGEVERLAEPEGDE